MSAGQSGIAFSSRGCVIQVLLYLLIVIIRHLFRLALNRVAVSCYPILIYAVRSRFGGLDIAMIKVAEFVIYVLSSQIRERFSTQVYLSIEYSLCYAAHSVRQQYCSAVD